MRDKLPKDIYRALRKTIENNTHLELDVANSVAVAMKEWAVENGATHFTHWFQPMTCLLYTSAMATSRPLMSLPSVSMTTRLRSPLRKSVWCVSASPSSQGSPALWMELTGAAPVPPSYPEIRITWAPAFATPAATVPTPASETSFTDIRAYLLAFFRS